MSRIKNQALAYLKSKPTFALVAVGEITTSKWKDKIFQVRCLDCQAVEYRNLEWLKSSYGCQCTRARKIGATHQMSGEEYSSKWKLSSRGLKLISEFTGMHHSVYVRCLRCKHSWETEPCNLRKAGCPKCAPALMRRRSLERYGVEFSAQRPDVQRKIKATMVERYGVEHALQNPQLLAKCLETAYATIEYQLGRRKVLIQGYEAFALDLLQSEGIKPKSIVCGLGNPKMPIVPYKHNGKNRMYHPDIFIPGTNTIIEVKSSYTLKAGLEMNRAKRKACMAAGYNFRCLVFGRNGSLRRDL